MTGEEKKLLEAAKSLRDYCNSREQCEYIDTRTDTRCEKCIFSKDGCPIWGKPKHWKLPHIKTNGDILLEKYPKARQHPDGRIDVCPDALGLIDCDGTVCVKCQNDYWNAPINDEVKDELKFER